MTDSPTYSARELAELAGTTVRTVHYYTAEGLLPAPQGSTRGASYSAAHLARLRIIAALREEGLSLARIRERLDPLTDAQALRVARAVQDHLQADQAGGLSTLSLIDLELARQQIPAAAAPAQTSDPQVRSEESALDYLQQVLGSAQARAYEIPAPPLQMPDALSKAPPNWHEPNEHPALWYEFTLDDGVVLRLRQERYRSMRGMPSSLLRSLRRELRRYGLSSDSTLQDGDLPQ